MSYYLGSGSMPGSSEDPINGAILLTSRENPISDPKVQPILGGIVERINGFTPYREFYSPEYRPDNVDSKLPDYRQTLFWNPILPVNQGIGKTIFFTADNLARYRIIVEGISENGNVLSTQNIEDMKIGDKVLSYNELESDVKLENLLSKQGGDQLLS